MSSLFFFVLPDFEEGRLPETEENLQKLDETAREWPKKNPIEDPVITYDVLSIRRVKIIKFRVFSRSLSGSCAQVLVPGGSKKFQICRCRDRPGQIF